MSNLTKQQIKNRARFEIRRYSAETGELLAVVKAGRFQHDNFARDTARRLCRGLQADDGGHLFRVVAKDAAREGLSLWRVEFTDTYCGEANYAWVQKFCVWAFDITEAITLAKRHRYGEGTTPRHEPTLYDSDSARIDIKGHCVCAFVEFVDAAEYRGKMASGEQWGRTWGFIVNGAADESTSDEHNQGAKQ